VSKGKRRMEEDLIAKNNKEEKTPRISVVNSLPKAGTNLLAKVVNMLPGIQQSKVHFGQSTFDQFKDVEANNDISIPVGVDFPQQLSLSVIQKLFEELKNGQFATAHIPYSNKLALLFHQLGIKMLLILRDPRDVVVSHAKYAASRPDHPMYALYQSLSEPDRIMTSIVGTKQISQDGAVLLNIYERSKSVLPWVSKSFTNTTYFEKIVGPKGGGSRKSQIGEVQKIFQHLGIQFTTKDLEKIADQVFGGTHTFRKGVVGAWQDYFTEEHRRVFHKLAGQILVDIGYEQDDKWVDCQNDKTSNTILNADKEKEEDKSEMDKLGEGIIFVISQPRSGSTLLQRLLSGHPKIHTMAEPWIMLHPLYALKREGIVTEYESSLARQGLDDFLMQVPEGEELYIEAVREMANVLYNKMINVSGKKYFLDKTPRYYFIIPELYRVFPKAKFIFLMRNPIAVLSSILKTWCGNILQNLVNKPVHTDLIKGPQYLLQGIKKLKEDAIVVHYEKLVQNPKEVMQHVCNRIGIQFNKNMLEYGKHPAPEGRFGDSIGIHKHSNPVSEYVDKWTENLQSPDLIEFAQKYLLDLGPEIISLMGYSFQNIKDKLEVQKTLYENSKGGIEESSELNQQGEDLYEKDNFDGALDAFTKALDKNKNNATTHNNLGVLYYNREDKEKAFCHYKKAAELQPQNITFQKNLADFYYVELGQVEEAMQIYVKVLNINPEDIEALLIIGHICVALEKFDDAKDFYNKVLQVDPGNKDARQNLGNLENGCFPGVNEEKMPDSEQNPNNSSKHELLIGDISVTKHKEMAIKTEEPEMEEYLVSAIVSTYNSERFIRGRLQNLIDQTLYGKNKLEIIVIDSNSPQNERQIVDEFKSKYRHIVYVRTPERETVYGAWNRGIQLSKGKYIINANTDDRFAIDALEFMADEIEVNSDIDAIYGDWLITQVENDTFESETNKTIYRYPEFFPPLFFYGQITSHATFIRKDVFDRIGLYDKNLKVFGDRDLMFRFSTYGLKARKISRVVGLYLINPTSLERSEKETGQIECSIIYDHFLKPKNFSLLFGYDDVPSKDKLAQLYADIGSIGKNLYSVDGKLANNGKPSLYLLMKAFEIDNTNVMVLNNLGVLLAADGKQSHAVKLFVGALQNSRGHKKTVIKKNLTSATNGSVAFADYACLMPDHLNYHISISSINRKNLKERLLEGEKHLHEGRDEEAEKIFKSELRDHPNNVRVHNNLGVLYYNKGIKGKALEHYKLAAQLEPENITFQKNLADFYYVELGRIEDALKLYNRALCINPEDTKILLIMGHICVSLKKFDNAKVFYNQALEIDPLNMDARQILDKLSNNGQATNPDIQVSIIMPTSGQQKYIKKCVESIEKYTSQLHEIIFVDNGATKGTRKWLNQSIKENSNYNMTKCPKDAGSAKIYNQGIKVSTGENILLLSNDVVVTKDWLSGMIECMKRIPDAGVIGPMSNISRGTQKVLTTDNVSINQLDKIAESFMTKNRYRRISSNSIDGFCMLFTRDLVEKIGLFDEQFDKNGYEDEDFCLRALLEGRKNFIAGDVYIHQQNKKAFSRNNKYFNTKWNKADMYSLEGKKFLTLKAIEKGNEAYQKGYIDNAVEIFLEGIGLSPNDKRTYYALAEILIHAKKYKDATDVLNEMPPGEQDAKRLELIGYAKEGMKLYDKAQNYANQALYLNPSSAPAMNLKGVLAYNQGDNHTAEDFFNKAVESDPGYGEPYTNLGAIRWDKKQDEALNLFEKGCILLPTSPDIIANYHTAASALGEFERAGQIFKEAGLLYPNNKNIKYKFIDFLLKLEKHAQAVTQIEEAITLFGVDDGILSAALKIRDLLGPKEIDEIKNKINTVSLCMIVKNEEQHLAKCLRSVKPIVDEMIIVDTGSTDRTKDIAKVFGAKVYDYKWNDDFSEARNFSISKASGMWSLILDADEAISSLDHNKFKKIIEESKPVAYQFTTRNYSLLCNMIGWNENDEKYINENAGSGWIPSDKVRLFPNKHGAWFEYPIHELIEPSLKKAGLEVKKCKIPIHHYGKLDQKKSDDKDEIYYHIGRKKLDEMGDNVVALCELAIQAKTLGKYEESIELWERLIKIQPETALAFANMGTAYAKLGKFEKAVSSAAKALGIDPDMKEAHYNYAFAKVHLGQVSEAILVIEKMQSQFSDYPPAQFLLAVAYCLEAREAKWLKGFEKLRLTMGTGLAVACHEFAKGLVAVKRPDYAVTLLEAAIKSKNINKKIYELYTKCLEMMNVDRKTGTMGGL
jgi:tetratricopeptide (TPR) repeat protein